MPERMPPRLFHRFFRWYCRPRLRSYIEGDLLEVYGESVQRYGKRKADLMFAADVLLLFRPSIIRPFEGTRQSTSFDMYKSLFKLSLRHLIKNRSFAFINLFGLTIGFLSFLVLALYIHDELSFDRFHKDSARTYRMLQHEKQEDGTMRDAAPVAALIGKESQIAFPEIESFCRLTGLGRLTLGNDPANRDYHPIISPDANFFRFFDFPLIEGTPDQVLVEPGSVVLSEDLAIRYFGTTTGLIGKRLWSSMNREGKPVEFTVSGVMKNFPPNSHIRFDILFSESTWAGMFDYYTKFVTTDWTSNTYVTYLKLKEGTGTKALEDRIGTLVKSHYPTTTPYTSTFTLQPLKEVHLYSEGIQGTGGTDTSMKPIYLYMFGAAGVLLLVIASLNYMNMATAVAIRRTREMGVRKSLGAFKGQLLLQFVSDSFVICVLALMVSLALLYLLLPMVSAFMQKQLLLSQLPMPWFAAIGGCILLVAVASAIYPAIVSLGVPASRALKGELRMGGSSFSVRKVLLSAQFAISIAMIAATLVIYNQLKYIRELDLGVNVESLLVIDINSGRLRRNFETVKAEFSSPAEVLKITTSTRVPGEWKTYPIATVHPTGDTSNGDMIFLGIDDDFLDTYQIPLKEGRNFVPGSGDSLKVILTESGVRQLGLTHPVGSIIEIPQVRYGAQIETLGTVFKAEVIGVAADFHAESLRKTMTPVIFASPNTVIQRIDYYTLKIKTSNWEATIDKLKKINEKLDPNNPLEYTFLDNRFNDFYKADALRGQIFLIFSIVIVIVTCMGLFALVSYSLESRTKEIGVRKVLGASVRSIVALVSRDFVLLVIAGGVVGLPAAWYFMRQWLDEFAYRLNPGPEVFLLALIAALAVALLTVTVRTARAASENPVKSLRAE